MRRSNVIVIGCAVNARVQRDQGLLGRQQPQA